VITFLITFYPTSRIPLSKIVIAVDMWDIFKHLAWVVRLRNTLTGDDDVDGGTGVHLRLSKRASHPTHIAWYGPSPSGDHQGGCVVQGHALRAPFGD
jgi:hypothetical protein